MNADLLCSIPISAWVRLIRSRIISGDWDTVFSSNGRRAGKTSSAKLAAAGAVWAKATAPRAGASNVAKAILGREFRINIDAIVGLERVYPNLDSEPARGKSAPMANILQKAAK